MVSFSTQKAVILAPGVALAGYHTMLDPQAMYDVKVVVNCGQTSKFLTFLDECQPIISSDVIVLNLDPHTSSSDLPYKEFHSRFNRVLQNYLTFFYSYNKDVHFFINSNYQNGKLALDSPTMNGVPLKSLFNINRLLKLIKNVNGSANFLFVADNFGSDHHSNALLYSLAISYLMDNYNYNFDASSRFIQTLLSSSVLLRAPGQASLGDALLNSNHYDELLLIDSLKKFYVENGNIKQAETGVMTKNHRLKRSMDSLDAPAMPRAVKRAA